MPVPFITTIRGCRYYVIVNIAAPTSSLLCLNFPHSPYTQHTSANVCVCACYSWSRYGVVVTRNATHVQWWCPDYEYRFVLVFAATSAVWRPSFARNGWRSFVRNFTTSPSHSNIMQRRCINSPSALPHARCMHKCCRQRNSRHSHAYLLYGAFNFTIARGRQLNTGLSKKKAKNKHESDNNGYSIKWI